ncbi:MAG: zinc-binding dehydrogenase [Treponema sp.]|jgi:threonine dehydrogenase-like Zn-dependent dehydrogenase|nr:zinc-binding dehydrogenase [Treponema sp.]
MKTLAVRIHGANDLRLESFELPPTGDDEILARIVSDSLCMSSHKLAILGDRHKRVRGSLAAAPAIIGHECCGIIEEAGSAWKDRFKKGDRFAVQPAVVIDNPDGTSSHWALGYSYSYAGGDATWVLLPGELIQNGCLLKSGADNFYSASLAEPVSCVIGAFHAQYHTGEGSYLHRMGPREGGSMALLAGVGPMGLLAIDYALHGPSRPGRLIVTDINEARLERARRLLSPEKAAEDGVELTYVNTGGLDNPAQRLKDLNRGKAFDDVFVFAPVREVIELGDKLLGRDGCLNFFAGPTDTALEAALNFYQVHYDSHHIVGTSGGNVADMEEGLSLMTQGKISPVFMVTHVGGLNTVPSATLNLPGIPGGKKLIYTHKKLELTAIDDFAKKGETEPLFARLAELCDKTRGLWNKEAEDYLLAHAPDIDEGSIS